MIFGNRIAKMKLVEQLTLVTLQTAHHGSTSPRFASTQPNHGSRPVSTDFCNKIGQNRKSGLLRTGREMDRQLLDKRKPLPERRPAVITIFCPHQSVMRLDNGARDGQSHAHALGLAGEKRFE